MKHSSPFREDDSYYDENIERPEVLQEYVITDDLSILKCEGDAWYKQDGHVLTEITENEAMRYIVGEMNEKLYAI